MSGEDEGIGRRDGVVWINEGATVAPPERIKEHEMSNDKVILFTDHERDEMYVEKSHDSRAQFFVGADVYVRSTDDLRKIAAHPVTYADEQDRPEPLTIEIDVDVAERFVKGVTYGPVATAVAEALAERKAAS